MFRKGGSASRAQSSRFDRSAGRGLLRHRSLDKPSVLAPLFSYARRSWKVESEGG